jgi:hypothetical protein
VKGSGPSLFGRNWLSKLTLDWHHIRSVSACFSVKDKVNELMKMEFSMMNWELLKEYRLH